MNNDFMNSFQDGNKLSLENLEKINAINLDAMQKLAALQISLTNLNISSTAAQARLFTSVTEPNVLLHAETALVKGYGEQLMKIGSETTAVLSDSREKLVSFAKDNLDAPANEVAAKSKTKARTAKKAVTRKTAKKVSKKAA